MRISRVCALAGAALSAAILSVSFAPAQAADFGYGSVKDVPPPPSGRTWYLKGTIGMSSVDVGSLWTPAYDEDDFSINHKDIKSAGIFALGIGVEHSRWLRFDVTGEYRGKQLFVAHDTNNDFLYTNDLQADMESWVGLANAYIDIGTWRGVTPYVGGGVGFASITLSGFQDVKVQAPASVFYGNGDETSTNFAWALYAGLSYDVTPQFTVDMGYRYLDMGDAFTGDATAYDGTPGEGLHLRDIVSHDLLFSARYRLDQPQAMYAIK